MFLRRPAAVGDIAMVTGQQGPRSHSIRLKIVMRIARPRAGVTRTEGEGRSNVGLSVKGKCSNRCDTGQSGSLSAPAFHRKSPQTTHQAPRPRGATITFRRAARALIMRKLSGPGGTVSRPGSAINARYGFRSAQPGLPVPTIRGRARRACEHQRPAVAARDPTKIFPATRQAPRP